MQQTEVRTETERHWDNIAITTIAVATAALAAVFFIMRENLQGAEPAGDLELFSSVMGLSASTLYLIATGIAGTGIFGGIHLGGERRAQWKRHRTHEAFAAFWTILVATAIIAFTTFTLPTIQSWYRELGQPGLSTTTEGSEIAASSLMDRAQRDQPPTDQCW